MFMGYNFRIMLKYLAVFLFALLLIPFQAHAHPDEAQQASKGDNPPSAASKIAPKQANSPGLQSEGDQHVDADVRVISSAPKDIFDIAAFAATMVLVAVAVWAGCLALKTLRAIEKQADIANRMLIAQFRPKVIVRRIELFNGAGNWNMHIEVENIGGTKAITKETKLYIRWRVGSERRCESLHDQRIDSFALEAGEGRGINFLMSNNGRFNSKMDVFKMALREGTPNRYSLQVIGEIPYVDGSGAGKKTGFSRFLDIETMRFNASQNPEDEYQD
ncbi:MAG TPA: hypothetical protein VIY53_17370 [Acidobacteriaceae bacterium]